MRLPGTPVKTFRLRVFLFRAAEEPYTPEDLAAEARYLDLMPSAAASSAGGEPGALGAAMARAADPPDGTCSEFSAAGSAPGDGATTPSTAADTELAWEAGFRAGQESAILASGDEWAEVLGRRMAGLARVASNYMMGGSGWQEEGRRAWSLGGGMGGMGGDTSPPPSLAAPGLRSSFDSGAAAAASAAAGVEVARRAGSLPYEEAPAPPAVLIDADADSEFQSMFESKYELRPAGGAGGTGGERSAAGTPPPAAGPGRRSPPPAALPLPLPFSKEAELSSGGGGGDAGARCLSPNSLLPTHISIFGDGVAAEAVAAAAAQFGAPPPPGATNLPARISEFGGGDEDDSDIDDEVDALVRAALPEEDLLDDRPGLLGAPPEAARLPTDFELLAAATAGPAPRLPTPRAAAAGAAAGAGGAPPPPPGALRRSASVEDLLSKVHRVDAAAVTVVAKIGEGAFGEVSLCECPTYGRVAVKWIKPTKVERHWEAFWHEAELMSRLNHPNVLRFYGLVTSGRLVVGIMTEFAAGGSLAAALRSGAVPGNFLPLRRRAQLALHAVNGMAYLHSQKVVHFDVKPDNLLVDGDWGDAGGGGGGGIGGGGGPGPVVKVADFGLSVVKYNTFCSNVQDLRGTLPYMAPEVRLRLPSKSKKIKPCCFFCFFFLFSLALPSLAEFPSLAHSPLLLPAPSLAPTQMITDHQHVTEKADVWSLGVVLWELLTLQVPYADTPPAALLGALGSGAARLPLPEWCEPEWRAAMESCWVLDPELRPTCRELARQLERVRDAAPLA
jgi:serine/threonine protein kinase